MSTTNAEVETGSPANAWEEVRQTILRTALDGFWIADTQGRFLEVNQAYCDLIGYRRDELLAMSIHDVEALENPADVERHIQRIIAAGSGRFETRHRCKDARFVDVEVSVNYLPANGNLFVFLRDITERKQAGEVLRNSEECYRGLFQAMREGFAYCQMLFDGDKPRDFLYLAVNKAFEALTGLTGVVGRKVSEVIPGLREAHPELFQLYGRVALTGIPEELEIWIEPLGVCLSVSVYSPKRGYFVAVFDNVTAEKALRESQERLRLITDHTVDVIWLLDWSTHRLLYVSSSVRRMLGYSPEELVAREMWEALTPQSYQRTLDIFQSWAAAAQAGGPLVDKREEMDLLHQNGSVVRTEVTATPLTGKDGHISQVLGVIRDITERSRAEEALMRSEEELRALFDEAPVPYHEIDRNGIVRRVNRVECEMLGFAASEMVGRPIWDFIIPEEKELARASVARKLMGPPVPAPLERRFRSRSGAEFVFQIHARLTLNHAGEVVGIRSAMIDLTETKQLDARLAQDRQLLHALMDQTPDHIYFKDREGRFTLVNPAQTRLMGCTDPSQMVGKTDFDFFSPEHAEPACLDERDLVHERVPMVSKEEKETWPDGRETWVHTTKLPLRDPSGKIVGTFGISRDTTERHLMEEALHASEGRLKLAQEALSLGTWELDLATNQPRSSEKLRQLYGCSGESMNGEEWLSCVHPDDRAEVMAAFNDTLRTGETLSRQFRVVWPDGSVHWLHSMCRVLRDADRRPVRVVGIDFDVTEHARTEESLRILSTAVEQSPVSIVITDLDGNIEYANAKSSELTGYTFEELKGKNSRILKSGETPLEEYRRLWETIQTSEWRGVFHNRKKNGEMFWESATIGPVRDALGDVTRFLAVKEDITARKHAEHALAAEAVRRRILFEQSKDGVVVFDRDGKVYEANLSFARMLGYSMEEMRRLHVWDWDAQLTQDQIEEMMKAVLSIPATFETHCKRKDGTLIEVEVSSSAADLNGEVFFYAVCRDVSERKAAERALRESEKRFRLITETISEVFWLAGVETGTTSYVSPAYERVWGRSRESLYEKSMAFIATIHPDDRARVLKDLQVLKSGGVIDHEYRIVRPDGSLRWIWDRGFPIREASEPVSSYVGVALDITERKELERQLTQAQKLESIGQLAAGVAHEINTPIQYIGDNGKFLEEAFQDLLKVIQPQEAPDSAAPGLPDSASPGVQEVDVEYLRDQIPKAIGQLLEGVGQVARIVRAMKEFSHPGPVEKTPLDINRAIGSTILVSKNEWKYVADLTTDLDPELPPVPCLAGEFNQVMLNLIVNSAHAISDVVKQSGKKGAIRVSTSHKGNWAEIRVSDTGGGIPEAIRSRVFDPFFTTKEVGKGTGQGLAIAHSVVVQKHQGTITFESEIGAGTTFVIRLPLKMSREGCEANSVCG